MLLLLACVTQAPEGYDTASDRQVTRPGASDADADTDTDADSDADGPAEVVEPDEGSWVILSSAVVKDDCNAASLLVGEVVGETLELTMQSDVAFDFARSDGTLELCKLDGDGGLYSCAERFEEFDGNEFGFDVTIDLTYDPVGDFSTPGRSEMDVATSATCSGPDCIELADVFSTAFPCEMTFTLDAMLQ